MFAVKLATFTGKNKISDELWEKYATLEVWLLFGKSGSSVWDTLKPVKNNDYSLDSIIEEFVCIAE